MINPKHAPGTVDCITEMYELKKTRKVKTYAALFIVPPEISMVIKGLSVIGLELNGFIYDESITAAKPNPEYAKKGFKDRFDYLDLKELKQVKDNEPDTEIVIISNHIPVKEDIVINAAEEAGIDCRIYHFFDIPHSVVIDGKLRVLNNIEYLRSWPEHLQELNGKYMTPEEIERFRHGRYPFNNISKETYFCLENQRCAFTNILDGFIESGTYTPVEGSPKKKVTVIGDSRSFSPSIASRLNIPSMLQKRFMDEQVNCEVVNFSTIGNTLQNVLAQVKALDIGSDDIIICSTLRFGNFLDFRSKGLLGDDSEDDDDTIRLKIMLMKEIQSYCTEKGASVVFVYFPVLCETPNMTPMEQQIAEAFGCTYKPIISHRKLLRLCNSNNINIMDLSEDMFNTPRVSHFTDDAHFSFDSEKIIVDAFFEYVNGIMQRDSLKYNDKAFLGAAVNVHQIFVKKVLRAFLEETEDYIKYLRECSEGKPEDAGFLLMNCNPITKGHIYLIEEALKQVDYLYILITPEENPHFTYKDRYEMVRRAVAKYDNVQLIRGGKFFSTRAMFAAYFEREEKPDAVADLSNEIYSFSYQIAPALKVKKRFVGTEPNDRVTIQLNEQYKKALPEVGLELVEIPRKELNNRPISASDVRRFLKEKKYDELRELVPETTYDYLINELNN